MHNKTNLFFLLPLLNLPLLLFLSQPSFSLRRPSRIWTAWSALCGRQRWVTTPCFAATSSYWPVEMGTCCCRMPGRSTATTPKLAASSPSLRSSSRNNPWHRLDFFFSSCGPFFCVQTTKYHDESNMHLKPFLKLITPLIKSSLLAFCWLTTMQTQNRLLHVSDICWPFPVQIFFFFIVVWWHTWEEIYWECTNHFHASLVKYAPFRLHFNPVSALLCHPCVISIICNYAYEIISDVSVKKKQHFFLGMCWSCGEVFVYRIHIFVYRDLNEKQAMWSVII